GSFRGLPSGSSDQHRPGDPHVIRLLLRVGDLPRQTHTGAATHLGVRPTGCRFHHPVGWDPTIHTIRASDLVIALVGTGRLNLAAPSARSAFGPAVRSGTIHTSHFCSFVGHYHISSMRTATPGRRPYDFDARSSTTAESSAITSPVNASSTALASLSTS